MTQEKIEIYIRGPGDSGKGLISRAIIDAISPTIGNEYTLIYYRNKRLLRKIGIQDGTEKLIIHIHEYGKFEQIDLRNQQRNHHLHQRQEDTL